MKSLTKEKRYDLIDAFNSTSRYLEDLLNVDNIHFEHMHGGMTRSYEECNHVCVYYIIYTTPMSSFFV